MKKIICLLVVCLLVLTLCTSYGCSDEKTITVGASPTPHAQILEKCRSYIETKGYKLKIVEFEEYILPNVGVTEGSLDANFFQHEPYLKSYNASNNTNLVSVLNVHFEPLGLYKGRESNIDNLKNEAEIGIPNDSSNCERALFLLQDLGIITLGTKSGSIWTVKDIKDNPKNVKLIELEASQIRSHLPSLDYAIINGNYAIEWDIVDDLIESEDSDSTSAQTYPNVLCVNGGNENTEKTKILIEALKQKEIKDYIINNYANIVIPLI